MQKNKATLEITKNQRVFQFLCETESTLGECFDVLTEMRSFVIEKIKEASAEVKNDDQSKSDCKSCG